MKSNNQTVRQSNNSHRGFTVLELLVASLLLGMLMTILTMIFNQSSIAWRTGTAGEADMKGTRQCVAEYRYEADNAYPDMQGKLMCVQSVFDEDGKVRTDRLIEGFYDGASPKRIKTNISVDNTQIADCFEKDKECRSNAGYENGNGTYVVNVKCSGPDREMGTYDDIWSFPDDPNEW